MNAILLVQSSDHVISKIQECYGIHNEKNSVAKDQLTQNEVPNFTFYLLNFD